MRWHSRLYMIHRWLGLVVGLQLLAWSVSGFTFTWLDIDNVRGDSDHAETPVRTLPFDRITLSVTDAVMRAAEHGVDTERFSRVVLRDRRDAPVYEMFDAHGVPLCTVDGVSGHVTKRLSAKQAEAIALADFEPWASGATVRLLEGEPPLEFRNGRMPVYQVTIDHPKHPHLYICPVTGEVLKRRNRPWRIFDFFWMLHIMDYGAREDFNHWLLTGMSIFAIATSASGLTLWTWRIRRGAKRVFGRRSSARGSA